MQAPASGVKGDARKDRRAPACQTEQFPLWCKGGKDVRGFPKHHPKVSIPVQQDHDHEPRRADVIAEPTSASSTTTLQAKTTFGQAGMYSCPPSNLAIVGSLPAIAIWEEDPGRCYI